MTENTLTAMLFHRPFSGPSKAVPELGLDHAPYGWLRNWSIEDLYSSDILLSKLFRRSLPEHAFAGGLDAMNRLVSGASMTADAGI